MVSLFNSVFYSSVIKNSWEKNKLPEPLSTLEVFEWRDSITLSYNHILLIMSNLFSFYFLRFVGGFLVWRCFWLSFSFV